MIKLDQSGSGRDLVLLPGWGSDGSIFSSVIPTLESHFRVHLGRWQNASNAFNSKEHHSYDSLSNDELLEDIREGLIHQLDHQGVKQAIWVGWSLGGLIATDIAKHHPEKVISLMTLAFNPCFVQQDNWSCAMPEDQFREFQQAFTHQPMETLNRFIALQVLGAMDRRVLQKSLRKSQFTIDVLRQAALLNLLQKDLRPAISKLSIKQMHCYGELDALVPSAKLMIAMKQLNPQARTQSYALATHLPFISAEEAWLKDLLEWCAV